MKLRDIRAQADKEIEVDTGDGDVVRFRAPDYAALVECGESFEKVYSYMLDPKDKNITVMLEHAANCVKACAVVDDKQEEFSFEDWVKIIKETGGPRADRNKLVEVSSELIRETLGVNEDGNEDADEDEATEVLKEVVNDRPFESGGPTAKTRKK